MVPGECRRLLGLSGSGVHVGNVCQVAASTEQGVFPGVRHDLPGDASSSGEEGRRNDEAAGRFFVLNVYTVSSYIHVYRGGGGGVQ